MKFQTGDRIKYFGAFNELLEESKATVERVEANGLLYITLDQSVDGLQASQHAHPRQCRKLRPATRVWLPKVWGSLDLHQLSIRGHEYLLEKPHANTIHGFDEYVKVGKTK